MDMRNLLSKIDGLLAEDADIKRCIGCGEKTHVDYDTGMCIDCLDQTAKDQGHKDYHDVIDAPKELDENFDDEKELDLANGDKVRVKDAGPHSEVFTLSQYEHGARRAWIGDKQGRGWYISPSRLEKAEDVDNDEYNDEYDEELDEASLTKNAMYNQMKKTSNPSNYEPEVSDEPVDDFEFDDHDTAHPEVEDGASCWGCGQDWRENWSAEDLGTGEGYEEHGLEPEDRICPDCAEELTGGELNEAEMPAVPRPHLEKLHNLGFENSPEGKKARENWKTATGEIHPAEQKIKGRKTQKASTNVDTNTVPVGWIYMMAEGDLLLAKVPKNNVEMFLKVINEYQNSTGVEDSMPFGYGEVPWVPVDLNTFTPNARKKLLKYYQKLKPITHNDIPAPEMDDEDGIYVEEVLDAFLQDPKICAWIDPEEIEFDYNDDQTAIVGIQDLDESAMCEDCGASPCVCEDPLAEAKAKNYYAIATAAIKKKYNLGKGKVDLTDAQTAEAHKLAKKLKKEAKKLDESEEVDESKECDCAGPCSCKKTSIEEMRQLAGLNECGEMWVEPIAQEPALDLQKSKMTVTTSMDSEAGKQITVTAEGDGADELIKVLQMAGINVAPTASTMVDEELANEPDPQTLDSKSMLIDLSGGPNRPQAMTKHGYHQGDNPYAMVEEAVDSLAARLKAQFKSQR